VTFVPDHCGYVASRGRRRLPAARSRRGGKETRKMANKVQLLDYVAGNIRSLVNAIEKCGFEVEWIKSPEDVKHADVRIVSFCFFWLICSQVQCPWFALIRFSFFILHSSFFIYFFISSILPLILAYLSILPPFHFSFGHVGSQRARGRKQSGGLILKRILEATSPLTFASTRNSFSPA
jgi:hypothetical protein